MELNEIINKRMSIRKFSDKEVPVDLINQIVTAGIKAPTAKNNQPEKIYVVTSKEGLNKIDLASPCRYNAPCSLLVCSDKSIAFSKGNWSSYEMDATIVATHMMLAATNVGVDNIWIEMFDADIIKREFDLEENIIPVCIINLGYRADDCPESPNYNNRKDISEIVKFI